MLPLWQPEACFGRAEWVRHRFVRGVRETDAMIVAQQFIAGNKRTSRKSVKRTTEVFA